MSKPAKQIIPYTELLEKVQGLLVFYSEECRKNIWLALMILVLLQACAPSLKLTPPVAADRVGSTGTNQVELIRIYSDDLYPVLLNGYRLAKEKEYEKSLPEVALVKKAVWKLHLAKERLASTLVMIDADQPNIVKAGYNLVNITSRLNWMITQQQNILMGYIQAYSDKNLSYLTDKNEEMYNQLSDEINTLSNSFLEAGQEFSSLLQQHGISLDQASRPLKQKSIVLRVGATEGEEEDAGYLRQRLEKYFVDYGFKLTPQGSSVFNVMVIDTSKENILLSAGRVLSTLAIPNSSPGHTLNEIKVRASATTVGGTCQMNWLDQIDASMRDWEQLNDFVAQNAVEEFIYGPCIWKK